MPTLEERLATLEAKYGTIEHELQGIHRSLGILTNVGLKKELHDKEMAENMTMLLGISSTHQREGKEMQREITEIKGRLDSIELQMSTVNTKLDTIITMLNKGTP